MSNQQDQGIDKEYDAMTNVVEIVKKTTKGPLSYDEYYILAMNLELMQRLIERTNLEVVNKLWQEVIDRFEEKLKQGQEGKF